MNNSKFSHTFSSTHKIITVALLFGSILLAPKAPAQNVGRWYSVEVLIFKRMGASVYSRENWPTNIELSYPTFFQHLKPEGSGNFSLLPTQSYKLNGFSYALKKDKHYRVLTHKSWYQRMDKKNKSPAIIINGGELFDGYNELGGTIKIHIARYLHVVTDLWLVQKNVDRNGTWPQIPLKPSDSSTLDSFSVANHPVVALRERRRMRSKEIHYIDHPLMGVLILFTPINR